MSDKNCPLQCVNTTGVNSFVVKSRKCAKCGNETGWSYGYCRPCHAARMREYNKTYTRSEEAIARSRARNLANMALKAGKIERQPCSVCGTTERVEMHHPDHRFALEVVFYCKSHHVAHHKALRNR